METEEIYAALPGALLPWYRAHHRDLPWRENREPYRVWLSEIMLQQTRVEAVKGYYARFLAELPTVEALANADAERLHKLWEGLGYYSRVRNLKKAAQTIQTLHGGAFPREYEAVRALPGIGDYTAGAICSICFDQPTPAVDGNVLRLMARLENDDTPVDLPGRKREVCRNLARVYPREAGEFTQALMELGATICGPNRKPDCAMCPCGTFCRGYQAGRAEALPVKSPRKTRTQEDRTVFILNCEDRFALVKRPDTGLLAGLWEFPNVSGTLETGPALARLEKMGLHPRELHRVLEKKHIFTHIQWNMTGYYLMVSREAEGFVWMNREEIEGNASLPTAFRQFWVETAGMERGV